MGWINHMTTAGLIRNAQVLTEGGKLVIVRAAAGDGGSAPDPAREDGAGNERLALNCTQGVQREDNRIRVRVDWANDGLEEALSLTEVGLFVEDGEGGELLFCIATSYDTPLPVPVAGQGRFELQMELICDLAAGAAPVEAGSPHLYHPCGDGGVRSAAGTWPQRGGGLGEHGKDRGGGAEAGRMTPSISSCRTMGVPPSPGALPGMNWRGGISCGALRRTAL